MNSAIGITAMVFGALLLLFGILEIAGANFLSKNNPHPEKNTPKSYRIAGAVLCVVGIIAAIIGLVIEGVSFDDVLKYTAIAGIVIALFCTIWFFSQEEKTKGVISLVVLALVIGVAVYGFSGSGSQEGEDSFGHDWAVAMTVAEKAVKSELKSPSSAEFSSKNETTINVSGNTWTVSGWVEAQNSFGATIRNSYSVKFTFNSSDKYTIEYCNIN